MTHINQAFVAFDVAKLRNAVAVAESGRDGEVRYHGEIDNTDAASVSAANRSPPARRRPSRKL